MMSRLPILYFVAARRDPVALDRSSKVVLGTLVAAYHFRLPKRDRTRPRDNWSSSAAAAVATVSR